MKMPENNRVNCRQFQQVLNKRKYGVQYLEWILHMCATKTCHDGEKRGGGFRSYSLQFSSLRLANLFLIYVINGQVYRPCFSFFCSFHLSSQFVPFPSPP